MVNYQNGKIYKITSIHTEDVYVGKTTKAKLSQRLAEHVLDYKRHLEGNGNYVSSSKIIELGDYDILLLESFACNSKDELKVKERYWYDNTPNCINKNVPNRTDKESNKNWEKNNKEHRQEYQKKYRLKKKE